MTTMPEIVLGITGSIGAYKAADVVRHLKEAGYAVTCVMTQRATKFLAPLTLQTLSERKVYTDLFDEHTPQILHTSLADHAKLVLIAPATANIIAKFANGIADDLVSCLLLATRAKVLIAPAMNVQMWQHPTVQRNVTALKRLGHRFVGPDVGKLACGYEAIGHLAETEDIIRAVRQLVPSSTTPSPVSSHRHPANVATKPRGHRAVKRTARRR